MPRHAMLRDVIVSDLTLCYLIELDSILNYTKLSSIKLFKFKIKLA